MWLFEVSLLGVIFGTISLKSESSNRTCFRSSLGDVEDALTQNSSCFTFRIDEKLILLCKLLPEIEVLSMLLQLFWSRPVQFPLAVCSDNDCPLFSEVENRNGWPVVFWCSDLQSFTVQSFFDLRYPFRIFEYLIRYCLL